MALNPYLTGQIAKGNSDRNDSADETIHRVGGNIGWQTWIAALLHAAQENLQAIENSVAGADSLPYGADYADITYIGSTNNIDTVVYKTGGSGGTVVATLTFTYVNAGAADDDLIETITKS